MAIYEVEVSRTFSVTVQVEATDAESAVRKVDRADYSLPDWPEWSGHKDWRYRSENVDDESDTYGYDND